MVTILVIAVGVGTWIGFILAVRLADIAQMLKEIRDRLPEG